MIKLTVKECERKERQIKSLRWETWPFGFHALHQRYLIGRFSTLR
jgi:hypothetical protein